ncbi:hypothetical protein HYX18_00655 [Candidatus Woesearchaeota archaeon]|nr:hypothetical protein [Candidatus Woesearchaeota archaeon]
MGIDYFHNEYEDPFSSRPYYIPAGKISATTSIQTPNQLLELQQRLNAGVKNVELSGPLDPLAFERIPLQHFDELRRLAKLTGAQISLHAPMFDLAGFTEQVGQGWSEENRKTTEEQFKDIVGRANKLDPEGNIPITIHTNRGIPSVIPEKGLGYYTEEMAEEALMPYIKGKEIPRTLVAIDQEEGRLLPLKFEEKDYLGKKKIFTPHERLHSANFTKWEQEVANVFSMQKILNERLNERDFLSEKTAHLAYGEKHGILMPEEKQQFEQTKINMETASKHADHLTIDIKQALNELHHKISSYGPKLEEDQSKGLEELRQRWESFSKIEDFYRPKILHAVREGNAQLIMQLKEKSKNEIEKIGGAPNLIQTLNILSEIHAPDVLIPVDNFVAKKATQTVVNTALHAYRQFKDKAPVIAIENWHPETALSRGESFQEFITKTKDEFARALVNQERVSENEARKIADKLIGATWDVAHINLLRRYGYGTEEIIEEAKKVKGSDIKKIHLADNFGYSDAHLVTGMGNVPTFEQLEELKKTGLGNEIPMVGEFGAFDVQFKEGSFPYVLEAANSPLYTLRNEPRWSAYRDTYPDYFTGYGTILPDLHFREFYGGGFSLQSLPRELGGQMPGDKSRFSGAPIE